MARAAFPKSKHSNLRQNAQTGRCDYDVRIKRSDGTIFRRAGSGKTEQEARRRRDLAYHEFNLDEGRAKDKKRLSLLEKSDTLRTLTVRALAIIREDGALSTHDAYRHALENHVLPALGSIALEDLRTSTVQELLNNISSNDKLGVGVAAQVRSALARVLQVAVTDGLVPTNVAKATAVSKRQRKQDRLVRAKAGETGKRILSRSEGDSLLNHAKGTCEYWPILLGLRFGLRSGEAMGLLWSAVDVEKRLLHVFQQAQCVKGESRHISGPKSASGIRSIPIPSGLAEGFALAKARAADLGQEFVCVDDRGLPYHPKHITRHIKRAVIAAGFDGSDGKPVPTQHDFRSSWLSWLANEANNGVGMKPHELMKLAGHSDYETTMSFYVRASDEDVRSAIESLYA